MENNIPPGVKDPAYLPDSRMKPCPQCGGTGHTMKNDYYQTKVFCEPCDGSGEIEMTFEECRDEDELIKESKADL